MAYESNDTQEFVTTIPLSEFSEIRISVIKDGDTNNFKALDIRQWYCTQKSPDMKPSQKGIRIKEDILPDVIESFIHNAGEVVNEELRNRGIIVNS